MEQVLLNLVVNAGDAMPAGGGHTRNTADFSTHVASKNNGQMLAPGQY